MSGDSNRTKDAVLDLLRVASDVERKLDRRLSDLRGVSFSEYQLIRQLAASPTGAARVDLAEAVGLSASAITRAIKPLEKMGYVVTERGERDARRAMARLTPAGHELLDDAEDAVDDGVADLDVGAAELVELTTILRRLASPR